MQPLFNPSGAFGALIPAQTNPTIGDRLTAKGVDWAWYSGGWSNADGDVGRARLDERHVGGRDTDRLPGSRRRSEQSRRRADLGLAALPEQPVPVPPPAVQLLPELLHRHGGRPGQSRRASQGRGRVRERGRRRRRRRATSSRSASSSRSVRRTSTRATPASPTAATTSWTCCRPSRAASAPRTRWSS